METYDVFHVFYAVSRTFQKLYKYTFLNLLRYKLELTTSLFCGFGESCCIRMFIMGYSIYYQDNSRNSFLRNKKKILYILTVYSAYFCICSGFCFYKRIFFNFTIFRDIFDDIKYFKYACTNYFNRC